MEGEDLLKIFDRKPCTEVISNGTSNRGIRYARANWLLVGNRHWFVFNVTGIYLKQRVENSQLDPNVMLSR